VAQKGHDGKTVPKLKRAFHRQCQQCHHSLAAANPAARAPTSCKSCHTGEVLPRRPGPLPRARAFHLSCITCHQKDRLARPTSRGPIFCDGCHREASPASEDKTPSEPDTSSQALNDTGGEPRQEQAKESDTGLTAPPDHILLEYPKMTRPGSPFDHKLHAALGEPCTKCHHTGLDQPRCRDCHSDPVDGKKVFHQSCITCHKENSVPAACGDCHKKK
jgi:mono/diheme cytochrome c family protein